ncbi:MAG: ATP-binding protein [Kofleriaceae bacterium]
MNQTNQINFAEVRGQRQALETVLEATIRHVSGEPGVLLLLGPPGAGKTMIARRIPTILPALDDHARCWLTAEYEGVGMAPAQFPNPPCRAPHYTTSRDALVGVGLSFRYRCGEWRASTSCRCQQPLGPSHVWHSLPSSPIGRVGELGLARFGVLFLDEITEFRRSALEDLAAAWWRMSPRTRPMVVASANPCPCGWLDSDTRVCCCSPDAINQYRERLASHVVALECGPSYIAKMRSLTFDELRTASAGLPSEDMRVRVVRAACEAKI